jgi:hypothetical protein
LRDTNSNRENLSTARALRILADLLRMITGCLSQLSARQRILPESVAFAVCERAYKSVLLDRRCAHDGSSPRQDSRPQVANFGHLAEGEPTQAGAGGICNLPICKERMAATGRVPVVR